MSEKRSAVATNLRIQRDACAHLGSTLYAELLDRMASDVEGQGPSWRVLEPFASWDRDTAYVLRLMGAVHRLVLTGEAPALAPHFGPGADPKAAWAALTDLLTERGHEIQARALEHSVQTNEVGRAAALAPAMLWLSPGRPLRLLELGASAGLNLRWDRYRYEDLWGDPHSPVQIKDRYEGTPPPFDSSATQIVE